MQFIFLKKNEDIPESVEESEIPKLITMARTIRDKLDGITFRHISNVKQEGFNNKIRWLIRQTYSFRAVSISI